MALHLKDLMAKAESKGIKAKNNVPSPFLKSWQEESVLFNDSDKTNLKPSIKEIASKNDNTKTNRLKNSQNKPINRQQTDNKVITNRQQSGNETGNKLTTNRQQKKETGNKVVSQPATEVTTNRQQTDNKLATNWQFSELTGLQRVLVSFIYHECKISRSKTTENLTLEYISSSINHPKGSIKTTLQRLEHKKFILRVAYKNGRGGWSRYSLEDSVFRDLLQHETDNKLATNRQQTGNKVVSQPATEPATRLSSSSSIYNNRTTTTELPEEWSKIDLFPIEHIGFSSQHLIQLYKAGEVTPKNIQDSIEHFAFDLSENNKAVEIKTNPLGYFMGIMKRSGVYTAPENYETPKDRAMRIYIEKQKAIQKRRENMENELLDIAFSEWRAHLSEEEKNNILPDDMKRVKLSGARESYLKQYFRETLWAIERTKKIIELEDK